MKLINLTTAFLFCFLLFSDELYATHAAGMDISYECVSSGPTSDTYEVTLKFYRDCGTGNAPEPNTFTLDYSSLSCNLSGSITLYKLNSVAVNINPICLSYCNGGTTHGIEEWTYTGKSSIIEHQAFFIFLDVIFLLLHIFLMFSKKS